MKFAVATPLIAFFTLDIIVETAARAAHDGKYNKQKYGNGNHGKYVHTNGGDYVEDLDRYRYVHYDDGDRGRYIHVHVPYDGGYGNYEGGHEPFRNPPYDASGLYADSSLNNPFKANEFDIRQPSIYLEYGTPEPEYVDASSRQEKLTSASSAGQLDPRASTFPGTSYLPVPKPAAEYGPPERTKFSNSAKPTKSTSLRTIDIGSVSLTTTGQESKLSLVTENPETTRTHVTLSKKVIPEVTDTTATPTTTETAPATTRTTTTPTTTRSSTTSTTTPKTTATTTSTAAILLEPRLSIGEQLHQCRSELQTALLKLSHNERSKCD
nr:LOW QUALITY PROTEIN: exocyst complex component 5-like [Aedes albopictus]